MADSDQLRNHLDHLNTAAKPRSGRLGTRLAINDKILGGVQIAAGSRWGGARKPSDGGVSRYLTRVQCEGLLAAAKFSFTENLSFNRHWTVHYQSAGIAEAEAVQFIGRLLKLAGDYARRNRARFAAIWAREGGDGKGGHVHILLHLPSALSLRGKTRRWIRLAGGISKARVSRVRAIGGTIKAAESGGQHYRHSAALMCAYILKGADPAAGGALGLSRYGEAGEIVGKRCGWTQNIGRAARAR